MKPRVSILLLQLLLFSMIVPTQQNVLAEDLEYNPVQEYEIILFNYDQEFIDLQDVEDLLPTSINGAVDYTLNYDIKHADASFSTDFNNQINALATPDWTSKLDEAAIREQVVNFRRTDIFDTINGVSINARALETYFDDKIEASGSSVGINHIFILNLSRLDTPTEDHWLNVTEVDPDSGFERQQWRLEWDDELNRNVRFPYSAFSETTDLVIIDPTAHQWYLDWRTEWTPIGFYDPFYESDLDHIITGRTDIQIKEDVISTVAAWVDDWIMNMYNMRMEPVALGSAIYLDIKIPYYSSEVTEENLSWVVNIEAFEEQLGRLLITSDVTVNIEFIDLEEVTIYKTTLFANRVSYKTLMSRDAPFDQWLFYDGVGIYEEMFDDEDLVAEFDGEDSDSNTYVRAIIYILDNASFVGFTPWAGGLYTGLGGDKHLTMLYELDRIFQSDHLTPKSGVTRVLMHEAGHAVGIIHPFNTDQGKYASDFASEVMGYYTGAAHYSELLIQTYHRTAVDQKIKDFLRLYNRGSGLSANVKQNALDFFEIATQKHGEKNYPYSYIVMIEALNILINEVEETTFNEDIFSDENILFRGITQDPEVLNSEDSPVGIIPIFFAVFIVLPIVRRLKRLKPDYLN